MKLNFKNFLSFEKMITPVIIKILFYIGLVGSAIGGIAVLIFRFSMGIRRGGFGNGLWGFVLGLFLGVLTIALGILFTRIYCELLILIFRINDTLSDIKQLLKDKFE